MGKIRKPKITKKSDVYLIKRAIISQMKEVGVYNEEFDIVITVLSDMIHQYNFLTTLFYKEGMIVEVETNDGKSTKKSGTISAIESLRKDIGTYTDRLMLNPKSLKEIGEKDNKSKLERVMEGFNSG